MRVDVTMKLDGDQARMSETGLDHAAEWGRASCLGFRDDEVNLRRQ